MAVTNETELSPQAPPQGQKPAAWYQNPQQTSGNSEQNGKSPVLVETVTGDWQRKAEDTVSKHTVMKSSKKTDEMTGFMDDLTLSSPKERSRSRSRSSSSRRSSSRSSSRSSYSSRSSSSSSASSSSTSWSRSRSRSRSRAKRNCSRRCRRYSRSYSRSRSRSRSYRYRERYHPRYERRYYRSPSRYRSRSRSPRRSYYRTSYSRSRSRSRRYYGFGRTFYPEAYRSWRSRSRSRSRSRTPLRLTEKEKRELLEIAKANAAKALGADKIVLPSSLRIDSTTKDNGSTKPEEDSLKFVNALAKSAAVKPATLSLKEATVSTGREEKKGSPSGQWIPVKNEEKSLFHNFSPKSTSFRAHAKKKKQRQLQILELVVHVQNTASFSKKEGYPVDEDQEISALTQKAIQWKFGPYPMKSLPS
uniref:Arginine/serine-rich protein 1 n=1 Tax=Salvator merianae TaxID=96440 RepID=A0A8D0B077_SALMN